jgi:uncharacterized protein YwqG
MSYFPPVVSFPPELEPYANLIRPHVVPCLRLEPATDTGDPTQSYLGGQIRYWPGSWTYPRDNQHRMLSFLLQLNFAQMPPLPDFPTQGLLQLFVDWSETGIVGTYHHPIETKPGELWNQAEIDELLAGEHWTGTAAEPIQQITRPNALTFTPIETPPDRSDIVFERVFADVPAIYAYPDPGPEWETIRDLLIAGKRIRSKKLRETFTLFRPSTPYDRYQAYATNGWCSTIGGYGRFPQGDDPRLGIADNHDWVVLVKLLSDDRFGMNWGDGRELHVFIQRHRLLERDFSHLWLYLAV